MYTAPMEPTKRTRNSTKKQPVAKKMPADLGGKRSGRYRTDRPRKKATPEENAKRKTFAKGEINPDAPKTPADRKRKDSPICGAKRTGRSASGPGICCQTAGWGTSHVGFGRCMFHGGNLPAQSMKAQEERDKTLTAQAVQTFGLPLDIDPATALMEELARTAGAVQWLGAVVADLDKEEVKQYTEAGVTPSVWIELFERERAHLVKVAETCHKCGIAERQIRIQEEEGKLMAMVLQAFIRDPKLALTPAQMVVAPKLLREHLLSAPMALAKQTESETIDI